MIAALLFPLLIRLALCHELPEFTAKDFDTRIKEKEFTLVMFYAPWCGHCKQLKPHFISAGKKLLSNKNAGLALVDCTTQDKICSRFQVSGYPTLKLFKDGEHFHDYDGSRDEDGILKYIKSRTQPPSTELTSASHLAEFLGKDEALNDPVVVSYIKHKSEDLMEIHTKCASSLLGLAAFAHSHDPSVFGDNQKESLIRLYRPKNLVTKLTDQFVEYSGNMDSESLKTWIKTNGHGLVGYRSRANMDLFPTDNILIFYNNVSIDKYPKGVNYHRNRLTQAIKDSGIDTTKLTFVYCFSDDFDHEVRDLQPDDVEYPLVIIKSTGKKFKLEKYDRENFVHFLKSFKSGTLEPHIKSEPVPTEQKEPAIKVVARSFDEVVNDPSKDAFVMFHAPWCGHCKQLMPKFLSVAEKLRSEPDVILATFDATSNDVPSPYEVRGYPTLYFAAKSSKKSPKRYEGGREEDDLIKFISKESTEELRGYTRDGKPKKSDL